MEERRDHEAKRGRSSSKPTRTYLRIAVLASNGLAFDIHDDCTGDPPLRTAQGEREKGQNDQLLVRQRDVQLMSCIRRFNETFEIHITVHWMHNQHVRTVSHFMEHRLMKTYPFLCSLEIYVYTPLSMKAYPLN